MKPKHRYTPDGIYIPTVGDRVKIINYSPTHNNKMGTIVSISGEMIFVKLRWKPLEYQIELHNTEIVPAPHK